MNKKKYRGNYIYTLFFSHVPVARGASLSRGITDEGHGGGIAYFTSIEYLILQ